MLTLAFICYGVLGILSIIFGLIYLTRTEFMPYHQTALKRQWQELDQEIQILILALMRAVGGGFLATGITVFLLMFIYLQTEDMMLLLILPVLSLITSFGSLYATLLVKTKTEGNPPLKLSVLSLVLTLIGTIILLVRIA